MNRLIFVFTFILCSALCIYPQNADFNSNSSTNYAVPSFNEGITVFTTAATWTTLPTSPHAQSRSTCAAIRRNDTAYIYQFGGGSGATLRNVARFNVATNTWTNNVSTMPQDISAGGTVVYGDSVIYVFGGYTATAGSITGYTLKYNIVTNMWTQMANITSGVTDMLAVKYKDSTIYLVGGGDGLFGATTLQRNTVQIYNPYTNTYSTGGTLPIPLAMMGGGIYGDTIMVFCGETTGGVYVPNCYKGVINPSTLQTTWTTILPYPTGNVTRMASYRVTKGGGVGIACTGGAIAGGTLTAATNFWNFCLQSWQMGLPNNSLARSNFRGCGFGDSILYAIGGYTTVGVGTSEKLTFSVIDGTCGFTGINTNQNGIPNGFILAQNYPNPFNPSTTISFGVPVTSDVKIVLTDILGREISVLVNSRMSAGVHQFELDGSSLSSGIYFYTMTAGDFKDAKKMLMIK